MNATLIKIAKFMAQRPKDRTIRLLHIVSGLIIIQLSWYANDRSILDIPFVGRLTIREEWYFHGACMVLGALLIIKGSLPWCLLKHRTLRIAQGTLGLLLIIIGGPIIDPIVVQIPARETKDEKGFTLNLGPTVDTSNHPGAFLVLLGILWIFIGLTGKGTTEKCLRYREVVKKIRV